MRDYFAIGKERLADRWSEASYSFGLVYGKDDGDPDTVPCHVFNRVSENFPLPNIWLGVSVENQTTADERIPFLLDTPAAVRWLSCEPLLGPVNLEDYIYTRFHMGGARDMYNQVDWVVAGGESGLGARPCDPDWIRGLRDQCQTAGARFFFKQWGAWLPADQEAAGEFSIGKAKALSHIHIWNEDEGRLSFKTGKKAAARLLDGREWNEFPETRGFERVLG